MALGPYTAGTRVKVADGSSQWRGHTGEVDSVDGDAHEVRLDGHACGKTVPLLTHQLRDNPPAAEPLDYSKC